MTFAKPGPCGCGNPADPYVTRTLAGEPMCVECWDEVDAKTVDSFGRPGDAI